MSEQWRSLLGSSRPCECGRTHVVATREIIIEPGAIGALDDVLSRHIPRGRGVLIADANTWQAAGESVASSLETTWDPQRVILQPEPSARRLQADEPALSALLDALPPEPAFLVCVGSGTLNDLTKLAATQLRVPSVCVATALSMNGYPSAIVAISRGSIKRTEPCNPPVAIICDTDVLARAPREMTQAGFGDLLSKSTSSTDWLMAHIITGEYFCRRPVQVVEQAERRCLESAAAIGRRDPGAIALLTSGLMQSGISMAMAGSSSPASGGEHLISHYWDMTAHARGRESDLHGRQVAVATIITAALYEALRDRTARGVSVGRMAEARPTGEELRAQSVAHFEPLVGAGPAAEIADLVTQKHMSPETAREALAPLAQDPVGFWERLGGYLRPSAQIREAYRAAGAPTSAADLGIAETEVRAAILYARHIRSRYTVLDLAADLGLLEQFADEVTA